MALYIGLAVFACLCYQCSLARPVLEAIKHILIASKTLRNINGLLHTFALAKGVKGNSFSEITGVSFLVVTFNPRFFVTVMCELGDDWLTFMYLTEEAIFHACKLTGCQRRQAVLFVMWRV